MAQPKSDRYLDAGEFDDRIWKGAPRGEKVVLTCRNHSAMRWRTKNIGRIGARTIFFVYESCAEECECPMTDLVVCMLDCQTCDGSGNILDDTRPVETLMRLCVDCSGTGMTAFGRDGKLDIRLRKPRHTHRHPTEAI